MADWKIGVDSSHLLVLPDPDADGPDNSPQRIGGTHTSLGGSLTVDAVAVKKYAALSWSQLDDDEHDLIAPFFDGTNGPGPFVFADAATGDQYTANITDFNRTTPKSGKWNVSITVQAI